MIRPSGSIKRAKRTVPRVCGGDPYAIARSLKKDICSPRVQGREVKKLPCETEETHRYLARRGERRVSMASVRAGLKNRKRFGRARETEAALQELYGLGFVRFYQQEREDVMGRPSKPMVLLHPEILKS